MASTDQAAGGGTAVRPVVEVSGAELLDGLCGALACLQANQEQINDLNVFPVPDGDTGSNMYLTLRSAVEEAQRSKEPGSAASVMSAAAHGSLMGARGNSGVIFSQILRGFSQGLENRASVDAGSLARALVNASTVAYKAVMKPTEGTILTVVRDAAAAAESAARESDDVRAVLAAAVREGHEAVRRTTSQLSVLREAGVVDAGGFGLAVILEGFAIALLDDGVAPPGGIPSGDSAAPRVLPPYPEAEGNRSNAGPRGAAAAAPDEHGFGFCTEFLINGPGLDLVALREELGGLGESAMIVGDDELVRVHIHTGDPQGLIAVASERGSLSKLKVEDMTAQHHEVVERAAVVEPAAATKPLGVVSVAPSAGFRDILMSLGADQVVEGGQTMNPSIEDLLRAVQAAGAESVLILPNNSNVILTAEQVDGLAEGLTAAVVPTRNLPQGVAALLALDLGASLEENRGRMIAAMDRVSAVEVTRAIRDTTVNGLDIKVGNVIALIDDEITQAGDDFLEVIRAVLRNLEHPPELVTVYRGGDVAEAEAQTLIRTLGSDHPGVEFELQNGGQDHYPFVLSLE